MGLLDAFSGLKGQLLGQDTPNYQFMPQGVDPSQGLDTSSLSPQLMPQGVDPSAASFDTNQPSTGQMQFTPPGSANADFSSPDPGPQLTPQGVDPSQGFNPSASDVQTTPQQGLLGKLGSYAKSPQFRLALGTALMSRYTNPQTAFGIESQIVNQQQAQKQRDAANAFFKAGYQTDPTTGKASWDTQKAMQALGSIPNLDSSTALDIASKFAPKFTPVGKHVVRTSPLDDSATWAPDAPETEEDQQAQADKEELQNARVALLKAQAAAVPQTSAARTMTAQAAATRAQKYQPGGAGRKPSAFANVPTAQLRALLGG